ncbi:hypothetical protein K8Z49_22605 [Actinomadura madurae]|uniref:hypothetical protein n=1 Tax=Actinomadura madurae TaxID=1993 RepID=UPI00399BB6A1
MLEEDSSRRTVTRDDDIAKARDQLRPLFAHLIGATSAGGRKTYFDVACQMGFEGAAHAVRQEFISGRRADAVPDLLIDRVALAGPLPAIADRPQAWKQSRMHTLILLDRDIEVLEAAQAAL